MRALVGVLILGAAGCSLVHDSSRFRGGDASSPSDSGAADAGSRADGGDAGTDRDAGPDAGPRDAGPRDAGPRDAGPPPPPVRVRVVNAVGAELDGDPLPALSVTLGGLAQTVAFGCTETWTDVAAGDVTLSIGAAGETASPRVVVSEDTLIVLTRQNTTSASIVAFARADVPPSAPGTRHALTYLNVLRQTATDAAVYVITDIHAVGESTSMLPFGAWSPVREYAAITEASVALGYADGAFGLTPRILATFTPGILTESTFVVLTGSAEAHPSAPGGPRAIVVSNGGACGAPVLADPQLVLANLPVERRNILTGEPSVFGCALDTAFAATQVNANELSIVVPVYGSLTRFGLAATAANACNAGAARIIDLSSDVRPGARYLVTVTGEIRLAATTWSVNVIEEAPPTSVTEIGLALAHLAPTTAPMAVDVTGGGAPYASNLALGAWNAMLVDPLTVPAGPWDVDPAGGGTRVGRYTSSIVRATPGGVFIVLVDQLPPTGTMAEPRIAFVKAGYGRPWGLDVVRPM